MMRAPDAVKKVSTVSDGKTAWNCGQQGEFFMRRMLMSLVVVVVVVSLTASVAVSASRILRVSFSAVGAIGTNSLTLAQADGLNANTSALAKGGKGAQGLCTGSCVGLFLHADGQLVGLGSTENTVVVLEATGVPVVSCTNPGGNQAPGQNPPKITTDGNQQIGITQITKKGAATLDVTTDLPGSFPGSQMGCPNDNWTATIVGIQFTNATISVFQDGALTIQESYTF
jgi:hypothetical protein